MVKGRNNQPPSTPTLELIASVRERAHPIGEFLEWLQSKGIVLAYYEGNRLEQFGSGDVGQRLMHEFFGVDERQAERERQALLDYTRQLQGVRSGRISAAKPSKSAKPKSRKKRKGKS